MTSCDKRLEELLNRAGQTISDLPKDYLDTQCIQASYEAMKWCCGDIGQQFISGNFDINGREKYILHLTDIIDRLEWALDKTLREKAYLRAKCCYQCGSMEGVLLKYYEGGYVPQTCDECDIEHVPDDWREDDAGLRSGTNWTIRRT